MVKKSAQKTKAKQRKAGVKPGARFGDSAASHDASAAPQESLPDVGPPPPSHIKRKVARQEHFVQKVVASRLEALAATRSISKSSKKRRRKQHVSAALGDLSVLSEALAAAAGAEKKRAAVKSTPKGLGVGGVAARQKIMAQESARLQQVLANPQFQADPFAAIASHLAATMPPVPAAPRAKKGGGQKKKAQGQAKQSGKQKAAGADAMDL